MDHKTFKEFLIEAKLQTQRARLKPIPTRGTRRYYTPVEDEDGDYSDGTFTELERGVYPVVRFLTQTYMSGGGRVVPRRETNLSIDHYVLLNPQEIIVNVVGKWTQNGKRVAQIEITKGGDQLVSYWNPRPFKKMRKRKGWREDSNFTIHTDNPNALTLSDAADRGSYWWPDVESLVMQKDLQ